ncbi:MFS transporter [Aureimonas flava]|uniref:MFS transporter n=1 Tax=Aureimonas flava TaxID=2320271 RepID=A0A3A1WJR8_9HYPH|nr:MFS transporter [Aureimonas flava]RIY00150.1 MFS transporter [Aureimonas flava]
MTAHAIDRAPSWRDAWPRERLAVSAAFLANGFVLGSWTPQIPLLQQRLGVSEARLGLLILAFGIGAVLAMPLLGAATARFGSRRATLWMHAALALSLPVLVLAPGVPAAGVAILLFGAAMGGMDVAMNANAVSVERRRPRAIMSSCHGFWSVGGFLGAATGGVLIVALGAAGHFVLVAALLAVALWPIGWAMLEDRDAANSAVPTPAAGGPTATPSAARLAVLGIGFCALFGMVPEGATIDWSAIYLRSELGADVAVSGFAFAAFSAVMALFRFLGDGIRDRLGAVRTLRLSALAGIGALAVVGLAPNLAVAILGFALLGIGLSNIAPIAFSAAGNVPGLKPGVGISMATTVGYSGILIAPSAIGYLAEHFGFQAVFLGLSGCLVFILALSPLAHGADRPPAA